MKSLPSALLVIISLVTVSSSAAIAVRGASYQVLYDLIQQRFPTLKHVIRDPHAFIYEIRTNGLLRGPETIIDLNPVRRDWSSRDNLTFLYTVNGKEVPTTELTDVHQVAGYQLMYNEQGDVSNVWGNGIFLEQLDPISNPDVLINTFPYLSPENDHEKLAWEHVKDVNHTMTKELETTDRQAEGCRTVEVAIAYDNTFCARFGNAAFRATAYIRNVVSKSNFYLKRDTCHQVRLANVEAHCKDKSDPYKMQATLSSLPPSTLRANYILYRFRTIWLGNRKSVQRDAAYFFSGFADGTGVGGAAFFAAACTQFGFGWIELGIAPIFLHEMGHSIGALHDGKGIMKSYLTPGPVFFSTTSKTQINSFLKSSRAKCVSKLVKK